MAGANTALTDIENHIAAHDHPAAIVLAGQHPQAYRELLALGTAYKESGQLQEAIQAWKKAYQIAGEIAEVRLFLLCGLWESGDRDSAFVAQLIASLAIDPALFTFRAPFDPAAVAKAMETYGMAFLKECFDEALLDKWDRNLRDNLAAVTHVAGFEGAGDLETSRDFVVPSYFIAKQPGSAAFGDRFAKAIASGNEYVPANYTESAIKQIHDDVIPRLDTNGILAALARFLNTPKEKLDTRYDYSAARVIHGSGDGSGCPHQDGRLQKRLDTFATFWTPFVPCGESLAPALAAVPVRLKTYFPVDDKNNWFERDAFPEVLYFKGNFEKGDVLLHSTFTLHKSYVRSSMKATRTSIDLRIF